MILWLVILFFFIHFIIGLFILIWKRNWKVYLLSLLPLIYAILDVYLECKATDNHSEACVWGYISYLYAIVIGSLFYITVTLFQVVKSKVQEW